MLTRFQQLFASLTDAGAGACKQFFMRWADPAASLADTAPALAAMHATAAYARVTMPATARQMVAALLENAHSHLRSVATTKGQPSAEVVASLVLNFVTAFFTDTAVAIEQQWAPGLVRAVRHAAAAVETRNSHWASLFLKGLFSRCVLNALVDPRRFGIFDRNVPFDFRRGLYTAACSALDGRHLLAWLTATRRVFAPGWLAATHEYHTLHAMKGWRGVVDVCRARCRRVLLHRFRDVFVGSTSSSSGGGGGGGSGSGSGGSGGGDDNSSSSAHGAGDGGGGQQYLHTSASAQQLHNVSVVAAQRDHGSANATVRTAADAFGALVEETADAVRGFANFGQRSDKSSHAWQAGDSSKAPPARPPAKGNQAAQTAATAARAQELRLRDGRSSDGRDNSTRPSSEMLVETHTFRLIDPLIIAINAVTQSHSQIASPLMSPNAQQKEHLEIDLWAHARTRSSHTSRASPTPSQSSASGMSASRSQSRGSSTRPHFHHSHRHHHKQRPKHGQKGLLLHSSSGGVGAGDGVSAATGPTTARHDGEALVTPFSKSARTSVGRLKPHARRQRRASDSIASLLQRTPLPMTSTPTQQKQQQQQQQQPQPARDGRGSRSGGDDADAGASNADVIVCVHEAVSASVPASAPLHSARPRTADAAQLHGGSESADRKDAIGVDASGSVARGIERYTGEGGGERGRTRTIDSRTDAAGDDDDDDDMWTALLSPSALPSVGPSTSCHGDTSGHTSNRHAAGGGGGDSGDDDDDDDDDGGGDVSGGYRDDTSSVASASTGTSLVSSGAVSVWSIDSNHHHQLHHHHQHGGQSDEYDDLNSHAHCTTTSTSTSPAPPSPVPLALGRSSGARDAVSVRAPQHWGVMEPHACDRDGDSDERSDSAASDC